MLPRTRELPPSSALGERGTLIGIAADRKQARGSSRFPRTLVEEPQTVAPTCGRKKIFRVARHGRRSGRAPLEAARGLPAPATTRAMGKPRCACQRPLEVFLPACPSRKLCPAGKYFDLSARIRRQSALDGHPPAPRPPTLPLSLGRPPPVRPGEPCPAPPARRGHENRPAAEAAPVGSPLVSLAGLLCSEGVARPL